MARLLRLAACLLPMLLLACTGSDPDEKSDAGDGCVEDSRRCAGDVLEVCDDGDWSPVGLCPDGCAEGACREPACTPDCDGRVCGDDGCGGSCGACDPGELCAGGACVPIDEGCGDDVCASDESCATCPADCGACCGDGTCAPDESCATCPADCGCPEGELCELDTATCVPGCVPLDCATVECGGDGCGGDCGGCDDDRVCETGRCVAPPASCGDEVCQPGETCLDCPADCGFCCGNLRCSPEHGEDCATCPVDCGCGPDERCDIGARACNPACLADCDDRICGDDGCGGACGVCVDGACDADGRCGPPPAACGDGTCDPGEDCGTCPADCGACCGDGRCRGGESCATCPADCACPEGDVCDIPARACVPAACEPACQGRICGPDGCGGTCGACDPGELCDPDRGRCALPCAPQCNGRDCGDDGCGGTCGACDDGDVCTDGRCAPPCAPQCEGRSCGDDGCGGTCGACGDGLCIDGACIGGFRCDCAPTERCIAGRCRPAADACGPQRPDGLCDNGADCVAGVCVDAGLGCTIARQSGVCPVGALCLVGECQPFDADALCEDDDPCTADAYDAAADRCVHVAVAAACDDGDGCTGGDACRDGVCAGAPIAGCRPTPRVDPLPRYTRERRVELVGTRPAGTALVVNGEVALPQGPVEAFRLTVDLAPGENVFRLLARGPGGDSDVVTARIIYDDVPPATRITPATGRYLDGITVTVAATEPSRVYYTTDGSDPDTHADHFDSVHTFRVFDDTTLSVRAIDRAGNWQLEPRTERYVITGDANRWLSGPALPFARTDAAIVTDGARVHVIAGFDGLNTRGAVQTHDLNTGAWSDRPALPQPRTAAAAALVNGTLYVFGGADVDGRALDRADRLTAGGVAWDAIAPMPSPRYAAQAVVINGKVHVMGGRTIGGAVVTTHSVYDPATNTWTPARALPRPRHAFAAVAAPDGLVYLIGGEDDAGRPVAAVDVYGPIADAWTIGTPLPTPRSHLTATLDQNAGRVTGGAVGIVVAGGRVAGGASTAIVEEFLLTEGEWVRRRPLPAPRHGAVAVGHVRAGLPDAETASWILGGVVVGPAGPSFAASTVRYSRNQDHLRHLAPLPEGRFRHAVAALDDRLYVVGGRSFQATTRGYAYDPETGRASLIAPLPSVQDGAAAVAAAGRIWVIGGESAFGVAVATLHAYDPASDTWAVMAPMPTARHGAVAAVIGGEIVVAGGEADGVAVAAVEIYDPATDTWRAGRSLPAARAGAAGIAWQGRLYLAGGRDPAGVIDPSLWALDPEAGWIELADDGFDVAEATAARVAGRLIVFGGRQADGSFSDRRIVYDLAAADGPWFELVPESRLLLPYDLAAAAVLNGDVYLIGGNASPDPGPDGLPTVQKYAGRCLDGLFGPYEGQEPYVIFPDLGGGCGEAITQIELGELRAFGHHGQCNSFNACGNAEGCADMACRWFGHGEARSWVQGRCSVGTNLDCDLFRNGGVELDTNFQPLEGCAINVVSNVVCYTR
ncbi:MAG: chitobiase/beta-hexosaminidase C-terminal domain-containing protein [Myxococcales bacterium]|nr:chitobiase/beta-hexosaminidase C-terminal domain-containing protein [Myxococcales bacterium]